MCGIAGYIFDEGIDDRAVESLEAMIGAITHRGPDDAGMWFDRSAGVGLGHRRLSILDLSPAGRQPMVSASGRYVIVFNGEIYNHAELRRELERSGVAPEWRGHSDTEVLLAALEHWAIAETLRRSNGMFAFALWDRHNRALYLARDRLGEKPLYYGRTSGYLLFGSELKALRAHPAFRSKLDRDALALYLRHNYVPSPWTIWRGIHKLPPAHYLEVRRGTAAGTPECYWDFRAVAEGGARDPLPDSGESIAGLEALMRNAVAMRMEADVPLGAFLSGGIDSSTIVALMQAQSSRKVRTFSIGFKEDAFNEANFAAAVARHLGTDHTELYVSADDALALVPRLPEIWDEPFSDSSQLPTYLLCQLTRRSVTVSLSGDGGDELFAGYGRYALTARMWRFLAPLPRRLRPFMAMLLRSSRTAAVLRGVSALLPGSLEVEHLADRLPKAAELLDVDSFSSLYRRMISHWKQPSQIVLNASEPDTVFVDAAPPFTDLTQFMMYWDTLTYLPDDVLTKVDRASMAVSLEARVPFLDHRLVEYAWRLPPHAKVRGGETKLPLRRILYRYVPRHLVDRPKMGFGVPIQQWLTGPLREWAESLLNAQRMREDGVLDAAPVVRAWEEFKSGKRRWHAQIWDILMFQAWWERNRGLSLATSSEAIRGSQG